MTSAPADAARVRVLVDRIQAGIDYQSSCDELYRIYRRRVHSFFAARGFSPDECGELTQETFVRVFSGIATLQLADRFASWLFKIAGNVFRNELRHRGAAKREGFEESIESLVESQADGRADALAALSAKTPGPLDDALQRERLASLRAELEALPPQMRRCVYLRLYQNLKYREIAVVMRISIETVKAHLHQAQKRLRVVFSARQDDEANQDAL
jgi:RNA polymerase sigma-70 factor, ECF subfamily